MRIQYPRSNNRVLSNQGRLRIFSSELFSDRKGSSVPGDVSSDCQRFPRCASEFQRR